jgi:hypothetical protein
MFMNNFLNKFYRKKRVGFIRSFLYSKASTKLCQIKNDLFYLDSTVYIQFANRKKYFPSDLHLHIRKKCKNYYTGRHNAVARKRQCSARKRIKFIVFCDQQCSKKCSNKRQKRCNKFVNQTAIIICQKNSWKTNMQQTDKCLFKKKHMSQYMSKLQFRSQKLILSKN